METVAATEWLESHSSPGATSVPSRAATVRLRLTKALSFGSTTSSTATEQRCTDLNELDMEVAGANGVLALDSTSGGYSGWVHVATSRPGRMTFVKRYCRLVELVCRFYASVEDAEQGLVSVGRHVVISVHRVQSRNKTFAFTDYEDCTVLLHTCMGADFEHWYGTFAAMVKVTQVAKARQEKGSARRATTELSKEATRLQVVLQRAYRLRALTAPMLSSRLGWNLHEPDELPPVLIDEEDLERTHTVWLYVHVPWWQHLLQRRQRVQRYFVFSGTNVSCFSVNKEGKRAMFTHIITACTYGSEQDPAVVEVEYGHPNRKLRLSSSTNDAESAVAATAKYIQRALASQTG
uniref:PH domain-containing protein n=1 Tax=Hyaloperonospora arabidopsidis (strain Emoy2) TaxID=559515 RepID=M4BRF8_HYAAE